MKNLRFPNEGLKLFASISGYTLFLVFIFSVLSTTAQVKVGIPDPLVKYTNENLSLLVSQIGYPLEGTRVAYIYGKTENAAKSVAEFQIVNNDGQVLFTGTPEYSGTWVQGHFWKLDFTEYKDTGSVRVETAGMTSHLFPLIPAKELLIEPYSKTMILDQMETRKRTDGVGGFIDCGSDIRETNSHATNIMGIMSFFEAMPELFTSADEVRISKLMNHYLDFFEEMLQSDGEIFGGWWFDHVITVDTMPFGEWPNHLSGVHGFLSMAEYFQNRDNDRYNRAMQGAKSGLEWARANFDQSKRKINEVALLQWVETWYYQETEDLTALTNAKDLARFMFNRQVKKSEPSAAGLHGHFYQPNNQPSRLNYHEPGANNGTYWGIPMEGLIQLIQMFPEDPDASMWRTVITDFTYGFLKKASLMGPFGIVPVGEFVDVENPGLHWFSDIYHGQTMVYGIMAKDLAVLAEFLNDPELLELAQANVLWIAGLNTGYNYPDAPQSFSCIVGAGYQWLGDGFGDFANLGHYCVVNGLSATKQFKKRMPDGLEMPVFLCDESWISHTAAWLMGVGALTSAFTSDSVKED